MSTQVARRQLNAMGFRSRWVNTPQGRLHFFDARGQGHGAPVVLLHGLSASAVHFAPILGELRKLCQRVIAPDLPGHGLSERSDHALTGQRLWEGLCAGLDAVEIERFVLLGSSMGGFAAVRYATARPQRLAGLVLCSPGGAPLEGVELSAFKARFALRRHTDGLDFVDSFLSRRPPMPVRHALAWGVRQTMAQPPIRSLLASVGHGDFLAPEELRRLVPPTYLIWGQKERLLPECCFRFYAEHLPPSAWIERPLDFGHTPYLEHPVAFMTRIRTFMHEKAHAPLTKTVRPRRRRRFAMRPFGRLHRRPFPTG